jgi:hypothetical protein
MLTTPPPGALFYRVTGKERKWQEVLSGAGSYFSSGGRYNRVQQKTVYASEDPLVSISEYAFHEAVQLQRALGGGPLTSPPLPPPPPPFVSEHLLWCFTLPRPPVVVDVEDSAAIQAFGHRPYELLNPTSGDYHQTAMLADLIRQPNSRHTDVWGILAPSVRTPALAGYTPRQHIFFVPHDATAIAGKQVRRWTLTLEFADTRGKSVTAQTREINWARPWFRLGGARVAVPAYGRRPGAHPLAVGGWQQVGIRFV